MRQFMQDDMFLMRPRGVLGIEEVVGSLICHPHASNRRWQWRRLREHRATAPYGEERTQLFDARQAFEWELSRECIHPLTALCSQVTQLVVSHGFRFPLNA